MSDDFVLDGNNDIFETEPDWYTVPQAQKAWKYEVHQYSNGVQDIALTKDSEKKKYKFAISAFHEDISSLLIFFASRKGRYKGFWLPLIQKELKVNSIDASKIVVDGEQNIRHVYMIDTSKNRWARAVTCVTSGGVTTCTFASNLISVPSNFRAYEIVYVRFDSDVIDYNYKTSEVAEVSLQFKELEDEL